MDDERRRGSRVCLTVRPAHIECVSTNCSLETDADGKLMTVGGTWTFTPAEDAMVDVADAGRTCTTASGWVRTTDADGTTYNESRPLRRFDGSS